MVPFKEPLKDPYTRWVHGAFGFLVQHGGLPCSDGLLPAPDVRRFRLNVGTGHYGVEGGYMLMGEIRNSQHFSTQETPEIKLRSLKDFG